MPELADTDSFSPQVGLPFNPDFLESEFFADDLCLPSGGLSSEIDLDFDFDGIDWDFSVDDLLVPENANPPSHPSQTSSDGWPPESVVLTSTTSPATSGIINITSPESERSADYSIESSEDVKREEENGRGTGGTKIIKKREVRTGKTNINPRRSEARRLEDFSSCIPNALSEQEEKKKARLIRNRESAQLSRQRKKEYVEELEEKVRSMSSTIAELNSKISFFLAENLSLKQQLGGSSFPPGVHPPPSFASSNFSWSPYPPPVFRQQASPVPLVPIPKLKSQQAAASQTTGKCEKKKRESKVRKVASISLLGFLFFVLIYGGLTGRVDHRYQDNRNFREVTVKNGLLSFPNGMVLSDSDRTRSLTSSENVGFNSGRNSKSGVEESFQNEKVGSEAKSWPFSGRMITQNSSESLPACLYVPRNGRHVKINGNLIINSVLASEKAVAQGKSRDEPKHPSGNDVIETGLVIANLDSGLGLSNKNIGGRTDSYGSSAEYQGVLASDSEAAFMDTSQDGFLEQWFQEGMAGPIFNSGTCTEVFQFQISPSSASPTAIITSSIINATKTAAANSSTRSTSSSAHQRVIKNRRFLYPRAIPLPGSTVNDTKPLGKGPEGSNFQSNASGPPMVVSVLIDPREVSDGDSDGEGRISPNKSLQRFFVVILLDSVKYITYSCVLPSKSYIPHLVN